MERVYVTFVYSETQRTGRGLRSGNDGGVRLEGWRGISK